MASPSTRRRSQFKRNLCIWYILISAAVAWGFMSVSLRLVLPRSPHRVTMSELKLRLKNSSSYILPAAEQNLPPLSPLTTPVWWFAPFFSNSGMGSEATSFVLSLFRANGVARDKMWITQDGDSYDEDIIAGLPKPDADLLLAWNKEYGKPGGTGSKLDGAIAICHTFAGHWTTITSLCTNTTLYNHAYRIGRTMFETDRLPPVFTTVCNQMDEIWVPTQFAFEIFVKYGIHKHRLHVLGEPVNTTFFDPVKYAPVALPFGQLTVGKPHDRCEGRRFVFLSVFKFEPRKGWDVLLKAYLREFRSTDCVELYIITRPAMVQRPASLPARCFQNDDAREAEVEKEKAALTLQQLCIGLASCLKDQGKQVPVHGMPPVYLMTEYIPERDLPRYYKAADAFVLPTRGEGWGLPIVEAMSMGLPVIATNWSGMTEYLTDSVGYPLDITRTVLADNGWWFLNHRWAQPSLKHLRKLMRRVVEQPEEALQRGAAARMLMLQRYSPEVMARRLHANLFRIDQVLQKRQREEQAQQQKRNEEAQQRKQQVQQQQQQPAVRPQQQPQKGTAAVPAQAKATQAANRNQPT